MLFRSPLVIVLNTIGIFALNYFDSVQNDDKWYADNVENWGDGQKWNLCELNGIISEAGYGDGLYFVYVYENKTRHTIAIEIDFNVKGVNEE